MKFRFFEINKQFHCEKIKFLCEIFFNEMRFRFFEINKQFRYEKIEFLYKEILNTSFT